MGPLWRELRGAIQFSLKWFLPETLLKLQRRRTSEIRSFTYRDQTLSTLRSEEWFFIFSHETEVKGSARLEWVFGGGSGDVLWPVEIHLRLPRAQLDRE